MGLQGRGHWSLVASLGDMEQALGVGEISAVQ